MLQFNDLTERQKRQIRKEARKTIGHNYGATADAPSDPAIAAARGKSCRLVKVTAKGVKFDDGKWLPFDRFIGTYWLIRKFNGYQRD